MTNVIRPLRGVIQSLRKQHKLSSFNGLRQVEKNFEENQQIDLT